MLLFVVRTAVRTYVARKTAIKTFFVRTSAAETTTVSATF